MARTVCVASGPRFPVVIDAYLKDVQLGLQAADEMDHHRTLQRQLNPYHVEHLRRFFRRRLVTAIDSPSVVKYAMQREASSAAASIVNEELWVLSHLLRFAVQRNWLQHLPEIWFLPTPDPPRDVRVETNSLDVAVERLARRVTVQSATGKESGSSLQSTTATRLSDDLKIVFTTQDRVTLGPSWRGRCEDEGRKAL
jgi:hypothetical protein